MGLIWLPSQINVEYVCGGESLHVDMLRIIGHQITLHAQCYGPMFTHDLSSLLLPKEMSKMCSVSERIGKSVSFSLTVIQMGLWLNTPDANGGCLPNSPVEGCLLSASPKVSWGDILC